MIRSCSNYLYMGIRRYVIFLNNYITYNCRTPDKHWVDLMKFNVSISKSMYGVYI